MEPFWGGAKCRPFFGASYLEGRNWYSFFHLV